VEYLMGVWLRKVFSYMNSIHVTPGPFSVFKMKFFREYGFYREAHKTEDIEIALRIQSNNYRIENSVNAHVYTSGLKSFKSLNRQRLRWYSGFIKNTLDYKHLFGKKYGNLGVVFLPLAYLSVFIVLTSLAYQIVKLLISSYGKLRIAFLSNFDIFRWSFNFDSFFMDVGPVALIAVVSTLLMLVVVYHALILSRKKENTLFLSILCFILVYYFLYAYWWVSSIFAVVFKKKVRWGHKTNVV
jgi:cellulose synthase/poly-beta-1,6-N-acetylglucosamine synthase-like glycosyltransferase